jgi:CheY-like chemotaxis protein
VRNRPLRVLVAEDNRADAVLIEQAFACNGIKAEFSFNKDGEEMIRSIDRIDADQQPGADVIILDLNLPRRDGFEVLEHLRQSSHCGGTPVIIVTSSDASRDRERTAALGIQGYFRKPSDYDEFMRLGELVRGIVDSGSGA